MIASFIFYAIAIAALVAAIGWLLETALARFGGARRLVWIVAISAAVVVPPLATMLREPVPVVQSAGVTFAPAAMVQAGELAGLSAKAPTLRDARRSAWPLDTWAVGAWAAASLGILGFHLLGAWRLSQRARRWPMTRLGEQTISVAPDVGPALYGWWDPRVVFPAWLLAAPAATRDYALAHERQHLAARDPQILAAATFILALLPWNLPLWWMLRRLRFSMEVDCDARVVRAGADPADYGLALLFVSERQSRAPMATLALIERASQLERRIRIMVDTPRHRALVAGLCIAFAGTCALAAAQLEAPARIDTTPLKLPPSGASALRVGQSVENLVKREYPELLRGQWEGAPVVVVLMNEDFNIEKWARIEKPDLEAPVGTADFAAIGIAERDVPYAAITGISLPDRPDRIFMALYTEKPARHGERFISKIFPDTRAIDRSLFERYFDATARSAIPAGESPWVLLDRGGKVLRTGQEKVDSSTFRETLQTRFGGIHASEQTVTPITTSDGEYVKDLAGQDVQLVSIWLAPDSPPPSK
jgi:beta-lactamase regulating signal transducer with metallopeptidase domain